MPYHPEIQAQLQTQQPQIQIQAQQPQAQNKALPLPAGISSADLSHRLISHRVIPAVDISLGTVTFVVNGRAERHWHPEPQLIVHALAQSVRPARWFPARQILVLKVAAAGRHAGLERHFHLTGVKRTTAP